MKKVLFLLLLALCFNFTTPEVSAAARGRRGQGDRAQIIAARNARREARIRARQLRAQLRQERQAARRRRIALRKLQRLRRLELRMRRLRARAQHAALPHKA